MNVFPALNLSHTFPAAVSFFTLPSPHLSPTALSLFIVCFHLPPPCLSPNSTFPFPPLPHLLYLLHHLSSRLVRSSPADPVSRFSISFLYRLSFFFIFSSELRSQPETWIILPHRLLPLNAVRHDELLQQFVICPRFQHL